MHRLLVGLFALSLCTLISVPLAARDWHLGVEGGVNISDLDVDCDSDQLEAKNRNIQISAGYQVRLR